MKRIFVFLPCLLFALLSVAQDGDLKELEKNKPEMKEVFDPDFEWSQFDNKQGKCQFKKNFLELECHKEGLYACTNTELDFDVSKNNYILSFEIEVDKLEDEHCVGIVYDFKNTKNFKALYFGKKQFSVVTYENGNKDINKEGPYKYKLEKKKLIITLKKKNKRVDFYLGSQYIPLTTLKQCEITYPNVGFYIENETKIKISGLGYRIIARKDHEEKE